MATLTETLAAQLGVKPPVEQGTDKSEDTATETVKVDDANTVSTDDNEKKTDDKTDKESSSNEKPAASNETDVDKTKEDESKEESKSPSTADSVDITDDDEDPDDKSSDDEKIAFWKKHSRMWERKARAIIRENESLKKEAADKGADKELEELRAFKNSTILAQQKAKLAEKEGVDINIINAIPGTIDEVTAALKALKAAGGLPSKDAKTQDKPQPRPVPTFGKPTEKASTLKEVLAQQIEIL